jgi:hypothetical protein
MGETQQKNAKRSAMDYAIGNAPSCGCCGVRLSARLKRYSAQLLRAALVWLLSASVAPGQTGYGQFPAHQVLAGPTSGAATQPSPRALIPSDMPSGTSYFDSTYCNTIGYLIVRLSGAWTCSKAIAANPMWWGADPTGSSDSAAAFNEALKASPHVHFPPGKFKFLSQISHAIPTTPGSITVTGAGADNTILYWPSGNGLLLSLTSARHSFHIRDLTFSSGGSPGGAALIVSSRSNGVIAQNDITNATFRGEDFGAVSNYWTQAVNVSVTNDINFANDQFLGLNSGGGGPIVGSGNGVVLAGNSSFYAFNYFFAECSFNQLGSGILIGSYVQGLQIVASAFGGQSGIQINGGLSGVLAVVSVVGSQFAANIGIGANTTLYQYMVAENTFFVPAGFIGIDIAKNGGGTIIGNTFQPGPNQGQRSNTGAAIGTTVPNFQTAVAGNTFYDLGSGLVLTGGSRGVNVQGLPIRLVATHVAGWVQSPL